MAEIGKRTAEGEVRISPERKKQIRDDLTYFQLFAFQGPRITTGDGKRSLGQLNERDVSYEYSFGGGEWNNLAVAMGNHGYVSDQLSPEAEGVIDRFFPLIDPVCPARLQEKNGLIVLETALGDGKISVLMAGYANYELVRSRSPIPTGFELIFSDLGAANRFFKGLENDPTTAINEYVSAAIGGIEDGRHAAFGGKHPRIGYLGVRRYNDEMYQAGITVGGVKRANSWNNISEFADFDEKHKQEKINSINRPDPNSLLPEIRHKGYEGYSSFSRPPGYFSLVEKYGPLSYDGLSMETQGNTPPISESTPVVESQKLIFDSSAATDVGKVREHNEDVVRIDEQNLRHMGIDGLYIVADGMGGHGAGEVASAIAADVIVSQCKKQEFPRQIPTFDQLSPEEKQKHISALQEQQRQWLLKAVGQANHAIFERSRNSTDTAERDMGTTLVVAIRSGDQVAVANVGDSRLYIISGDGKMIQQTTRDHSLVASLVASNQITAEEAKVHPQRNVIYRTIGDKPRVEADVFFAKIPQGGSMILCSDGLSGMVEDGQIGRIVVSASDSSKAASELIAAANAAGGQDNISTIVVRNVAELKEKSPAVKTEKEWRESMQNMLKDPIAQIVYLQTGSLPAAAVAYEHRAEILSGKITKEQYLALVKRLLVAGKTPPK